MALTGIVSKTAVLKFNRGNVGVLTDIVAKSRNSLKLPTPTGGGGDEVSFYVVAG